MSTCVSEDGVDTSMGKGEGVPVPGCSTTCNVRMLDVADWPMLSGGDEIASQHGHNGLAKTHMSLSKP